MDKMNPTPTGWLRPFVFQVRYWLRRNQQKLLGQNNQLIFHTHSGLPIIKASQITIEGNQNCVTISERVRLQNTQILISGSNNCITIGADCHIGGGTIWIHANECQLNIAGKTTIAEAKIGISESNASITIGEDCMLSHGVDIRCGDSHSVVDLHTGERINYAKHIEIENHVWVGMHSRILKDVTIAANSVIAAGSIVTKSIPANSIAAGIPAKIKRQHITWVR